MGQWVHQQSSTMYVNRGIKWWFIVCCPEKQTSKKHIWVGPIFVHSSHLLLCVDSKSSPGPTTVYNVTPISFSTSQPLSIGWSNATYFFLLLLEVKLLHGVESCTWFKQEVKWGWGNLLCSTSDLLSMTAETLPLLPFTGGGGYVRICNQRWG